MASPCREGAGTCFKYCNIFLSQDDPRNVLCGLQGTIDLKDFEHDTPVCGETPLLFERLSHNEEFYSYVQLDGGGVLDWTVFCDQPRYTGDILVKVTCGDWGRIITVTIETDSVTQPSANVSVTIKEA